MERKRPYTGVKLRYEKSITKKKGGGKMKFAIKGQTLTQTEPSDEAAGSQCFPTVSVEWPSEWSGLHKMVQFTRDGISYDVDMDADGPHYIPAAVLRTPARMISVMAYGYNDDGTRATTNALYVNVTESLYSGATGTDDPTPSEYERLRRRLDEMGGDLSEAVGKYMRDHPDAGIDASPLTNTEIEALLK